ncbi:MAG: hypothetical protein M1831_005514 [Alyxoria varia]|nr:MAG: hypothetical protein M1831_005514 [Alyxoria varia]
MPPKKVSQTNSAAGQKRKRASNPSTQNVDAGLQDESTPPRKARRSTGQSTVNQQTPTRQSRRLQGLAPPNYDSRRQTEHRQSRRLAGLPPSSSALQRIRREPRTIRRSTNTKNTNAGGGASTAVTPNVTDSGVTAPAPPTQGDMATSTTNAGPAAGGPETEPTTTRPRTPEQTSNVASPESNNSEASTIIVSHRPTAPAPNPPPLNSHNRLLYIRDENGVVHQVPESIRQIRLHPTDPFPGFTIMEDSSDDSPNQENNPPNPGALVTSNETDPVPTDPGPAPESRAITATPFQATTNPTAPAPSQRTQNSLAEGNFGGGAPIAPFATQTLPQYQYQYPDIRAPRQTPRDIPSPRTQAVMQAAGMPYHRSHGEQRVADGIDIAAPPRPRAP